MATAAQDVQNTLTSEAEELMRRGMSTRIAGRLSEIFSQNVLSPGELDDRALEALRELNEDKAIEVLEQFSSSDLSRVQNKSAFLCGVMRTNREKSRMQREGQEEQTKYKGPDEKEMKALLDRTGYTLDITTGQRKYGGPPPNWEGSPPGTGTEKTCCQVFVGKIPRDCFEDELIPIFEECGQIYDFRLMIEPLSGLNRGYAFCTYTTKASAQDAISKLDDRPVRPGRKLGVCISVANNRLFVGSIPKTKSKEEILEEFSQVTSDLIDVIVYLSADMKDKNRGFAFLEYETHKAAALAKRRLSSGRVKVWGNVIVTVDWADPQEEPDEETMSKVKVVYIRNLSPSIVEDQLKEVFGKFGAIERVKKLKDYAFIHFTERNSAVSAIENMNHKELDGLTIEVCLAKPTNKEKSGFGQMNARGRGGLRGRGGPHGGRGYGFQGHFGYDGVQGGGYNDTYGSGGGNIYDNYYGGGDYSDGYQRGRGMSGYRGRGRVRGAPGGVRPGSGYNSGRGGAGMRGGHIVSPQGGRGGRDGFGGWGGAGGAVSGKRKFGADSQSGVGYPETKRKFQSAGQSQQQWGNQPIVQQPLRGGQGYGNQGGVQEWSSYGQQWYK